jgi:hypothetical protein
MPQFFRPNMQEKKPKFLISREIRIYDCILAILENRVKGNIGSRPEVIARIARKGMILL